ncbi:MAG: hypothetical protein K2O64_03535 [Lactobacillus sp.]|nr:hypothetical protein [Lactobacillus sp.]
MNYFEIGIIKDIIKVPVSANNSFHTIIVLQSNYEDCRTIKRIIFMNKLSMRVQKELHKKEIVIICGNIVAIDNDLKIIGKSFKKIESLSHGEYLSQQNLKAAFNKALLDFNS